MTSETIIEVSKTLIGNTVPIGDAFSDDMAFCNQDKLIELTESCINMLISNADYKDRKEYSVERIGAKAHAALQELKNLIEKSI